MTRRESLRIEDLEPEFEPRRPALDQSPFVANNATVAGDVSSGAGASIGFDAKVRADLAPIHVGAFSNIQDGCVMHAEPGHLCTIAYGATMGHRAVVHGTSVGDHALVLVAVAHLSCLLSGCTTTDSPTNADARGSGVDSSVFADGSGPVDGLPEMDARTAGGFGTLTGDCGFADSMRLEKPDSGLYRNTLDFAMHPYTDDDLMDLSEGGQEIIADGNAGGSSLLSEVFAFETLHRCEGATLLKTETEIVYTDPMGKITDLLVDIAGHKIGVSVTRAYRFPPDLPYTDKQATGLLEDKLQDILESSANVGGPDRWTRQLLHVVAYAPMHGDAIANAYSTLNETLTADTIVVVTVSEGQDEFLY